MGRSDSKRSWLLLEVENGHFGFRHAGFEVLVSFRWRCLVVGEEQDLKLRRDAGARDGSE